MAPANSDEEKTRRRDFLRLVCGGTAAAVAASHLRAPAGAEEASRELPTIQLGKHKVTRLISGGNPIGGFSHSTENMARHMREYFTLERTVDYLEKCVRAGINTWQFDHLEKPVAALRAVRERGVKLNFICLHTGARAAIKTVVAEMDPIAFVHHGGVTDRLFREGKASEVRDFVKRVHDHGLLAGVSSHCPDNIRRIADEGWENDLFMTCFYYVTRPREEQEKNLGKVTVSEPFFESDPVDMTNVILKVPKPCLAFKILAAGQLCSKQEQVENAFKWAFQHIKKTDAVIVGMYPRYEDEIGLNVEYTRRHGAL